MRPMVSWRERERKRDDVVVAFDDVEFFEWAKTKKKSALWFCPDLSQAFLLQRAINKTMQKSGSNNAVLIYLQENLLTNHQFLGFVSSNVMTDNFLTGFCLHSFAVYHNDSYNNTIVTCLMTSRQHILSVMQDRLLQLIQVHQKLNGKSVH